MPAESSKSYPVPALDKSLDILEALSATAVPLALSELAQSLSRKVGEIFRMCNRLEARGYIIRDEASGRYSLSLKLYALAHAHSPVDRLLKAAHPAMQAFTDSTMEACHLSILFGNTLLVIAQSESQAKLRLSIEVGARFELLKTASGRLLLAHLPAGESATMLNRLGVARGRARAELGRRLALIANKGFTRCDDESIRGVRDLSVLVGNHEAGVMAALACALLIPGRQLVDDARILRALRVAAAEITTRLGLAPRAAAVRGI